MRQFEVSSLTETERLAADVGASLQCGAVLMLVGTLGAGKTTFVQALGRALGITHALKSPTFTMLWEYDIPGRDMKLHHFDLYRLSAGDTTENIGLDEALAARDGIVVIEWADKLQNRPHGTTITIDRRANESRLITIDP